MFKQFVRFNDVYDYLYNNLIPYYKGIVEDIENNPNLYKEIRYKPISQIQYFINDKTIECVEKIENILINKEFNYPEYESLIKGWNCKQDNRLGFDVCIAIVKNYYDLQGMPQAIWNKNVEEIFYNSADILREIQDYMKDEIDFLINIHSIMAEFKNFVVYEIDNLPM